MQESSEITGLAKAEVIVITDGIGEAEVELVPAEQELVFAINRRIETRFCCAPHRVKSLVAGWLAGEGIIEQPHDFVALETDLLTNRVDIQVTDECMERHENRIYAATGPILGDSANFARRVDTALELKPDAIDRLASDFRKLFLSLRSAERMCYLCSVATEGEIVTYGEGFHRLNAMYRAMGEMLLERKSLEGKITLMNFGMSRLLVSRLARAGVAMAICMAPPTDSAIQLANDYYLTIISANMGDGVRVYSAPWRVV